MGEYREAQISEVRMIIGLADKQMRIAIEDLEKTPQRAASALRNAISKLQVAATKAESIDSLTFV